MEEIDLTDIINYLISKSYFILLSTLSIALIIIVISLNLKEIYRSEALLNISASNFSDSFQPPSQITGLASFAGIDLENGNSSKNKSPDYVVAKIQSRTFFKHIASFSGILEGIVAEKSYDKSTSKIIYDKKKYDSVSKTWKMKSLKEGKPSYIKAHELFLANLAVGVDKRTRFISIVYDHSSPFFANKIIELIVREVNSIQMQEDLDESEKALTYLTDLQSTNNIVSIEKSLTSLIGGEIQKQMLASINNEYLIEYIDEPFVPESRIFPRRTILVISTTVISFFLIVFILTFFKFVLGKELQGLRFLS